MSTFEYVVIILVCTVIAIFAILGINNFVKSNIKEGYRAGQIDYANGIIKFKLKTNPDKTTSWEEMELK
ncbi:MAG: hypothetical protein M0P71_00720 [Melioribacteraceae bacterium]|nr:hypothetical protein [Melioribacteraceae bacterium]